MLIERLLRRRGGGHHVLDGADDGRNHSSADPATRDLADQSADVHAASGCSPRRRSRCAPRHYHAQQLPPANSAQRTGDRVTEPSQTQVLGHCASDIAADCAAMTPA